MEISKRLRAIAEMVEFRTMADIGTDHAYVPIWLCEKRGLLKGIACDIHKEPLRRAAENIAAAGFNDKIETRLGDGLCKVLPNEVESVVIAGMGGMLCVSILEAAMPVVKNLKELVLSPHLDAPKVRRYLHSIGFLIALEHMIYDEGKYYTIIRAVQGIEKYETEAEYSFGRLLLKQKDAVLCGYLNKERARLLTLSDKLSKTVSTKAAKRQQEIVREQEALEEAFKWL